MRTNNKKSNCKSCKEKGSQKFNYMLILGFISFVFFGNSAFCDKDTPFSFKQIGLT